MGEKKQNATVGSNHFQVGYHRHIFSSRFHKWTLCESVNRCQLTQRSYDSSCADLLASNPDNKYYVTSQLRGLQYLAGLPLVGKKADRSHYAKMKVAYENWIDDFGVIDYSINAKGSSACNLFVGESIFLLYGHSKKCLNAEKKFFSAKEYWNNNPGFQRIDPKDVKAGDIAPMSSGSHVEIVTSVIRDRFLIDDGFCSIGAGRNSLSDNGIEKCDGFWDIGYTPRELEDSSNRFYRIK